MSNELEEIETLFEQFTTDAKKEGNGAAQMRARKTSVEIGKKLKEFRTASVAAGK